MATMLPADVQEFKTDGERRVYHFLASVAKPDERYLVWYTPDIQDREPDFILFCRQSGLIVFEVKDWSLDQIVEASPYQFTLRKGHLTASHKNPLKQARGYLNRLMDLIKDDGRLVSKNPSHYGNPAIPMNYGLFFPNINKCEYQQKGLDQIIRPDKVFFWDDLHPGSDIRCDPSGNCFSGAIESRFAPMFSFHLKESELNHLKTLLFPQIKVKLPPRKPTGDYPQRMCRLKGLDHHQEVLARKYDGGHRIISGPSGSGKTLVLVHKAVFLKQYNRRINKILFVCYNITLVNYIKQLLGLKKVPMGENGVTVKHFYELCADILGEPVAYENESREYYDVIVEETLFKVPDYQIRYDAILVDEGQDFGDDMFRIIKTLLNPETNNLTIALDDNQNIYQETSTWSSMGVHARERVHAIPYVYRNTREITRFASRFMETNTADQDQEKPVQLELFPDHFDFKGPAPKMKKFADIDSMVAAIPEQIMDMEIADNCPHSQIAVLYAMTFPGRQREDSLPKMVEKALEAKGILCSWTAENYQAKKRYDITTNAVSISTIHSAKGLDYACVFLLGLDFLEPRAWSVEQIQKLVYVAITRARYQLIIPHVRENDVIVKLKACL